MTTRRQTACIAVIGATFIVFAAWIYIRPRLEQYERRHDAEPPPLGPTISWNSQWPTSDDFTIYQHDKGSYTDGSSIMWLDRSALESVYLVDEAAQGFPVLPRPEGTHHTVTSFTIFSARFSVPFGVDRALALVGTLILLLPFVWSWLRNRGNANRPNKTRMINCLPALSRKPHER